MSDDHNWKVSRQKIGSVVRMFLKRLTMKGFKSFADATTLEFEQGVTAVVGPNGSGIIFKKIF